MALERIWLYPPLAFARLGPSSVPCDNYSWGENDLSPQGSGKTTIVPQETLDVAEDGTVTARRPDCVIFKDKEGFRPICPFFELHGEWRLGRRVHEGPITQDLLKTLGLVLGAVKWKVVVANLKAYHHTRERDDRIMASVTIRGDDTRRHELPGRSRGDRPLVPAGKAIPLGSVQVTKLTEAFPECRLRFTPPKGLVYAPTKFNGRVKKVEWKNRKSRWRKFRLPAEQLILNDEATWARWVPPVKDYVTHRAHRDVDLRTMPKETYAFGDSPDDRKSLGLVDDVSDGFVQCEIGDLRAIARVVVAPPHFAPDRRPMVSLADGLTDRVDRAEVLNRRYLKREPDTTNEIRDFLERVCETQGLMNLDLLNDRSIAANQRIAAAQARRIPGLETKLFPRLPSVEGRPLPLTELGRQRHRRMLSLEVLEDRIREDPLLLERLIRPPVTGDPFYDQRMPAFIIGSDSRPMHVTRRQYDLLTAWARRLRAKLDAGK
jgi:hypothetical protein